MITFQDVGRKLVEEAVVHAQKVLSSLSSPQVPTRMAYVGRASGLYVLVSRKWFIVRNLLMALKDRGLVKIVPVGTKNFWAIQEPTVHPAVALLANLEVEGRRIIAGMQNHLVYLLISKGGSCPKRTLEVESGLNLQTSGRHQRYIFWLLAQDLKERGVFAEKTEVLLGGRKVTTISFA